MVSKLMQALVLLAVLSAPTAYAQITVVQSDFNMSIGQIYQSSSSSSLDTTVWHDYVGGTGGGHLWNFTSIPFVLSAQSRVSAMSSVPNNSLFSGATAAWELIGFPSWSPFSTPTNQILTYGSVTIGQYDFDPEVDTLAIVYDFPSLQTQFPVSSSSSWNSVFQYTLDYGAFSTTTRDSVHWAVDAWGTIKYGSREVQALRVRGERVNKSTTYYPVGPPVENTITSVTLQFMTKDYGTVTLMRVVSDAQVFVNGSADTRFVTGATPVYEIANTSLPDDFTVGQNSPNPFNPETTIDYAIAKSDPVTFEVFNILGRKVWHEDFGIQAAGNYQIQWRGRDSSNEALPSGVYLYRLTAGEKAETRKMMLLK